MPESNASIYGGYLYLEYCIQGRQCGGQCRHLHLESYSPHGMAISLSHHGRLTWYSFILYGAIAWYRQQRNDALIATTSYLEFLPRLAYRVSSGGPSLSKPNERLIYSMVQHDTNYSCTRNKHRPCVAFTPGLPNESYVQP